MRAFNPWWEGKPAAPVPPFRRWGFDRAFHWLRDGPTPVTVIRGPRQVGKSTLQNQIIESLLKEHHVAANRILRVQFDELSALEKIEQPLHTISSWFENRVLGRTLNEAAHTGEPAYLFLDEVQNLREWAPQLKSLVDHSAVRVLVTGSSALRIEAGRDSLAGRLTVVELGPLRLSEIAGLRGVGPLPPLLESDQLQRLLDRQTWSDLVAHGASHARLRDDAFRMWSERGGYPVAHQRPDLSWEDLAGHLVETVVQRAIQHDLRQGERGRKRDEALLEQVFRLACRYAGQSPRQAMFIDEIKSSLDANIGIQRITAYMRFLDGAMLIKLIPPLELRLKRRRGGPKIALCDHGVRAAWLRERIPLDAAGLEQQPHLADIAGHIAESAAGYYLSGISHVGIAHFPERGAEPEVDYVLTIGEHRIPIEIKYRRRIDQQRDTVGLRRFIEKTVYNAPFGVLVTLTDDVRMDDPRIVAVSLPSLLLLR